MIAILFGLSVLFLVVSLIPESRLEKSFKPIKNGTIKGQIKEILELLKQQGNLVYRKYLSKYTYFKKQHEEYRQLLEKLWITKVKASEIIGLQYLTIVVLLLLGVILKSPILFMLSPIVVIMVPTILKSKWKKKRAEMSKDVLSLAELTAVGVSAGLSPLESLLKAIEEREGQLFDEIFKAITDVKLGSSANKAFLSLSNRIDLSELHAFIDQLIQAIETGSPGFSDSVTEIVRHLRELRQAKIEKQSEQAKAKLLIPLLFFFGAITAFLLGPLTFTFLEVF